jgi:hypothetical protein
MTQRRPPYAHHAAGPKDGAAADSEKAARAPFIEHAGGGAQARRLFDALRDLTTAQFDLVRALAHSEPEIFDGHDLHDPLVSWAATPEMRFVEDLAEGARRSGFMRIAADYWRTTLRDQARHARLIALGVPYYSLAFRQLVAFGRNEVTGRDCVVLGIVSGIPFALHDMLWIDAVRPTRWHRARRQEPVLCADPLALSLGDWPRETRIRLFDQPIDWLRAGARPGSYCVLDWDSFEARALLAGVDDGSIRAVCDSPAHARALAKRARPKKAKLRLEVAA